MRENCNYCGHDHNQHINSSWVGEHAGEVGICRYYDTVITGYECLDTTYESDSDDDAGWKPSTIHHNYGGNPPSYVANSYQTTHGNITYTTPRSTGGYVNSTTKSTSTPIWGKKYCAMSCGQCQCNWCQSEEGQQAQREQRERNRKAHNARLEALKRAEQAALEERKRWREATFKQRCQQRGVFRAILRGIKEVFICGSHRMKK